MLRLPSFCAGDDDDVGDDEDNEKVDNDDEDMDVE